MTKIYAIKNMIARTPLDTLAIAKIFGLNLVHFQTIDNLRRCHSFCLDILLKHVGMGL
jgi:hypothetical protein